MTKPEIEKKCKRALAIRKKLDSAKPLYEELDAIVLELVPHKEQTPEFGVTIKDNYENGNSAWRPACIRRFEIEKPKKKKAA